MTPLTNAMTLAEVRTRSLRIQIFGVIAISHGSTAGVTPGWALKTLHSDVAGTCVAIKPGGGSLPTEARNPTGVNAADVTAN